MQVMARLVPPALILLGILAGVLAAGAEDEWMFDPTFREGRASDRLHDGPPPLFRSALHAYVDLFEASFGLALRRERETALRDALETAYEGWDEEARTRFLALVAPLASTRQAARAGDKHAVARARTAFLRAVDERLAAAPDTPVAKVVRAAVARKLEVPWAGTPTIRGTDADAWLDGVELLVSLARNEDFRATPGQRDALTRELATAFGSVPVATRRRLSIAHHNLLRLEAAWDQASLARKIDLRWKAMGLLARLLPREKRITVGTTGDLAAYARAAAILRPTQSAYAAWSNAAAHPTRVWETVDAWLGPIDAAADHPLLYR